MKLTELSKRNVDYTEWKQKGYQIPTYDREAMIKETKKNPVWVHFGAGNIFRAFPAVVLDQILNQNQYNRGVIVAEGFDSEILSTVYAPYDNISLLVQLNSDGTVTKRVSQSIAEALCADAGNEEHMNRLKEIFRSDSLSMVSFTITEKGYSLWQSDHSFLKVAADDFKNGPTRPLHTMGILTALLYERFLSGGAPIALVSMDNCSHNGDKLKAAVTEYAKQWMQNGFVSKEFVQYLANPDKVSFPWSMIDKITPRPDQRIQSLLMKDGFEDTKITVTKKNTYIAPFVCAEETQYLVIEDAFPNGRPPLEQGGILFTTRKVVDQVEKMKVCTCLNPLHTALAIFGCLLGYDLISAEMKDPDLERFVTTMGLMEGMPVVVDPGIISPKDFLMTVLKKRLPNPYMPDSPQRIATDTSQKIPIRFGETLKAYIRENKDVSRLTYIPAVFAGYARYLTGIDDSLQPFTKSPDPQIQELSALVAGIPVGTGTYQNGSLKNYLSRSELFGIDLYECKLADKVEELFARMVTKQGGVREVLHSL